MILIADSGSTKADWKVYDGARFLNKLISTKGFNPFFHTSTFIEDELRQNQDLCKIQNQVEKVFFFGAGCSVESRNLIIYKGLKRFFQNAEIFVGHDLQAAVYAVIDKKEDPCIVSILGTGSNSAYYDGCTIDNSIPALGYVLGDEGSGTYYGKRILASYLYNRLPPKLHEALERHYNLTKEGIFDKVYKQNNTNVYLASFAKFLSDHKEYHYVKRLVYQGMLEFMDIHVCGYPNYQTIPTHFIGSIGYFFEDILREVATRREVMVGKIIRQPVHTLAEYIVKNQI